MNNICKKLVSILLELVRHLKIHLSKQFRQAFETYLSLFEY